MQFLCDEMLMRLGQWLRVAGYDVLIMPNGTDDRILYERAKEENRLLLTRDRKMKEFRGSEPYIVLLECNELDDCVVALNRLLPIDWHFRPFSRCMSCNTPLVEASEKRWSEVPEQARKATSRLLCCPDCHQLFWHGSHVDHMEERMQKWSGLSGASLSQGLNKVKKTI